MAGKAILTAESSDPRSALSPANTMANREDRRRGGVVWGGAANPVPQSGGAIRYTGFAFMIYDGMADVLVEVVVPSPGDMAGAAPG